MRSRVRGDGLADRHRELSAILEFARSVADGEGMAIRHLDDPASVRRYCGKADEVAAVVGKGRILDSGCLYAQMTYLLEIGLTVVPFLWHSGACCGPGGFAPRDPPHSAAGGTFHHL